MSVMAKDEHCMYCGQMHPNYIGGCNVIKQTNIRVTDITVITTVKHSIRADCPHCGEYYGVDILEDDDNFHVLCVECKKYFKAVRVADNEFMGKIDVKLKRSTDKAFAICGVVFSEERAQVCKQFEYWKKCKSWKNDCRCLKDCDYHLQT